MLLVTSSITSKAQALRTATAGWLKEEPKMRQQNKAGDPGLQRLSIS